MSMFPTQLLRMMAISVITMKACCQKTSNPTAVFVDDTLSTTMNAEMSSILASIQNMLLMNFVRWKFTVRLFHLDCINKLDEKNLILRKQKKYAYLFYNVYYCAIFSIRKHSFIFFLLKKIGCNGTFGEDCIYPCPTNCQDKEV